MLNGTCVYVLKRGGRKGLLCGNACVGLYCSKHGREHIDFSDDVLPSNAVQVRFDPTTELKSKILGLPTSDSNKGVILKHFYNMQQVDSSSTEYYKNKLFVDYTLKYPFCRYFDINHTLVQHNNSDVFAFISELRARFDREIYGMHHVKNEIINHVCKLITNPQSTRNNLALWGAAGVGKSKFIKILSEVLNIPMKAVSLGGVKDAAFFLGHGYVYVESGPGKILQNVIDSGIENPIMYFDELDKISEAQNGKDIHSFLSFLTDPTQNNNFTDHYFYGMTFDLSKVFFVFTFNDISKVDKILLDRLNVVYVDKPSETEMCTILQSYCIPEIVKNIGLKRDIKLSLQQIREVVKATQSRIDTSASSGVRECYRMIEKLYLEINKDVLCQTFPYTCTVDNVLFVPEEYFTKYMEMAATRGLETLELDPGVAHMYI